MFATSIAGRRSVAGVQTQPTIRYLTDADVAAAGQFIDAVRLVGRAYTDRGGISSVMSLTAPHRSGGPVRARVGVAWNGHDRFGGVAVLLERSRLGRRATDSSGLMLLLTSQRGRVVCALAMRCLRAITAGAATALAAQQLLGGNATSAAILGVLPDSDLQLSLIAERLPGLTRFRIADADPAKAAALCTRLSGALGARGIRLTAVRSGREAVTGSDLIVAWGDGPDYEWLAAGALVVLDGAGADAELLLRADLLIADDWDALRDDERGQVGRLHRAGLLAGPPGSEPRGPTPSGGRVRAVDAELSAVLTGGHSGRRHGDDIVVVARTGRISDYLAVAAAIHEAAQRLGLGIGIPTQGWELFHDATD